MNNKVVLVTGASSGLGLAVANHLSKTGYTVYAAARSFKNEGNGIKNSEGYESLNKVFLDVTDRACIENLLQNILQREGRLDILVNCAACLVLGAVEDISTQEFKLVLETNLMGTFNMCQGVLPIMREQKCGKIINFSSLNGVMGIPFQGAYVASKFAIEGLSECMSMEVKKFGISVVLIEPTDHRSGSKSYRCHAVKADSLESAYYNAFKTGTDKIALDESKGGNPEGVARLVARIIKNRRPGLRYTVGRFDQKFARFIKRILPGRLFEKIIADYYKA